MKTGFVSVAANFIRREDVDTWGRFDEYLLSRLKFAKGLEIYFRVG